MEEVEEEGSVSAEIGTERKGGIREKSGMINAAERFFDREKCLFSFLPFFPSGPYPTSQEPPPPLLPRTIHHAHFQELEWLFFPSRRSGEENGGYSQHVRSHPHPSGVNQEKLRGEYISQE